MNRTARWALAGLVAAGMAAAWALIRDGGPAASAPSEGAVTVRDRTIDVSAAAARRMDLETAEVAPRDVPVLLRITARTALNQERLAHVKAQFPGRIVDTGPQLGAWVQGAGDPGGAKPTLLCRIESVDLGNAKSAYQKAVVQLQLDDDALRRTRELVSQKVLADKFLVDAESAVTKDRSDVEAARHSLFAFGLKPEDLEAIGRQVPQERMVYDVASPIPGVILEKNVTRGEFADNTLNLFTIADTSTLWVWGDVYERDWTRIRVGQAMKLLLASRPGQPLDSRIDLVSPTLDAGSRSIRVRGTIPNPDRRLLADMYGTLVVTVDEGKGSLAVPPAAVVTRGSASCVFVRTGDAPGGRTVYERRDVTVEPVDETRVRVTQGLRAGDAVVVHGALNLYDEMQR